VPDEAIELATGYISLAISTKGLGKQIAGEFGSVQKQAGVSGKQAGELYSKGFTASASNLDQLRKSLGDSVRRVGAEVKKAREVEEAATRKVAIEEAKLNELRDSGKAKASQLLAAEDRLTRAQKAQADATEKTTAATKELADAQDKAKREVREAEKAADQAGKSFGGLSGKIKAGFGSGFRGLGRAARSAGSQVGSSFAAGFTTATSHLGSIAKAGIGGLAKVAGGGALALAAVGAAGAGVGIQTAAGMEQAKIAFSTMLGSGEKADKFLRKLADFAAKTPFEFPELQDAASSLISAGIEADKVIPIMTTLGDVTSGMGTGAEGVKRATVALQQMNAAGKISGEDLAQLRDAGIPVYDLLAKATKKSKAEVVDLANKGKLGKKELQQLMAALSGPEAQSGLGRFAGLMDKQSQSLTGLVSTLKDTVGQGLAKALQPAIPLIKAGLGSISDGLGSVFGYLAKNKGSLTEFFGVIGSTLKTIGTIGSAAIKPFVSSLTDGRDSFKAFADFLGTHQTEITSGLITGAKVAIEFADALAVVASVGLKSFAFLTDAQANLTEFMLNGFSQLLHGASLAFGWIPGVGDKLKVADEKFSGFAAGVVSGMHKAADGARGLADGVDTKLRPALDAARKGIDKVADQQKLQAASRDTAAAIGLIGTKANGSQIHLKKWSDITHLSSGEQAALANRIGSAKVALGQQLGAMQKAGAGQDSLTAAWIKGKKRLYDEFLQMGLSKTEAGKLADKYAGIKPKVSDEVQPARDGRARAARSTTRRSSATSTRTSRTT
jgi:tape measure domain-containing protein